MNKDNAQLQKQNNPPLSPWAKEQAKRVAVALKTIPKKDSSKELLYA